MSNNYLKEIINSNKQNRLAIFVGAGVSKTSNNASVSMPDWNELIKKLKDELGFSESNYKNENDNLRIAQLYYINFGKKAYYDNIIKYITDSANPSSVHKQIFSLYPNCIITTNWDTLLERTNDDNGYAYELIRNDKELLKATSPYKIIKMHGDFKLKNIVFKESDYLEYQTNFPLLENFIKSVLCTHTTLFLGYSYNDINLKQIINWINASSKSSPPMYFFTSVYNKNQEQYLESFGMKTIYYQNDNNIDDFEEVLKDNFMKLADNFLGKDKNVTQTKFPDLNDCLSLSLANFLFDLGNFYHGENYKNISDIEVLDIINSKLSHLANLQYILPEQICNAFTNSTVKYPSLSTKSFLWLHTKISTYDYNPIERFLNMRFLKVLESFKRDEYEENNTVLARIKNILDIIAKASIDCVILSSDGYQITNHLELEKAYATCNQNLLKYVFESPAPKPSSRLTSLKRKLYNLYRSEQFEQAYEVNERIISISTNKKSYDNLLIGFDNKNSLLSVLKNMSKDEIRSKYTYEKKIDISERLATFPKSIRYQMQQIYKHINFDSFNKTISYSLRNKKKVDKQNQTKQNGGVYYSNENPIRFSNEHRSLLSFYIFNYILAELFIEFKEVNQAFIELSLERQKLASETFLSDAEIFACIRYFDNKSLTKLFESFYSKEAKQQLKVSKESLNILQDITIQEFISIHYNWDSEHTNYGEKFCNLLFILSLIEEINIDNIFIELNKIFFKKQNNISVYESINFFLVLQSNLYQKTPSIKLLKEAIESMISYIVNDYCNGYDLHVINYWKLCSLFQIASNYEKTVISYVYVNKLVDYIRRQSNEYQIKYSPSLLLSIYEMVGHKSKKLIKEFILSIDTTNTGNKIDIIDFEIALMEFELVQFNYRHILLIKDYVKGFTNNSFCTSFYRLKAFLECFKDNKLGSNEERKELLDLITDLQEKCNSHEEWRKSR